MYSYFFNHDCNCFFPTQFYVYFIFILFFIVISLQVLPHAHLSKLSRVKYQERFVSSPRGAPVCERPVERLNAVFTYFN